MPVLTNPEIAARFKERWMLMHPEDVDTTGASVTLDDSLTSLQWLQDFSILSLDKACAPWDRQGQSQYPYSPPAGDTPTTGTSSSATLPQHTRSPGVPVTEVDYRTDRLAKPPYSYATLICMAMQASKKSKITLSAIYGWITENFCYYRHAEPSWQNSIRHNLSLNKCFRKVPRQKDEPGKGGFWQIDPQYADMFVNGVFKRRRLPGSHFNSQRQSKATPPLHDSTHSPAYLAYHSGTEFAVWHIQEDGLRTGHKRKRAAPEGEPLTGDFDWGSVFDDVFSRSDSSNFDLELSAALSSLGCELEAPAPGRSQWCGAEAWAGSDQHLEELLGDPQRHPWEELKKEPQAVPLTQQYGFAYSDGFNNNTQQWE